ncbi:MAG: cell wall-binding repeat-containing protein [Oscillospiraceae bacterium]|nr:cell wall-binding repeat-containing protein [Oscillospiraceae bacterium]
MKKRIVSFLLSAAVLMGMLPMQTLAAEIDEPVQEEEAQIAQIEIDGVTMTGEELFAGYVQKIFYEDEAMAPFAVGSQTAGARLTGDEAMAYEVLAPIIRQIAAGERASTEIRVYASEEEGRVFTGTYSEFDFRGLVKALLYDMPYEMYWFNYTIGYRYSGSSRNMPLEWIQVKFTVDPKFRDGDNAYQLDLSKTAAAARAAENARTIAGKYQGKSDYEKLCGFRDEICRLVSYNYDAASGSGYQNNLGPWQMIYVFDLDPNTNVVCEGYAKAFQYLCDISGLTCYNVSGYTGGNHRWNIVTLGGKNYLVDVTNTDDGHWGADGSLFLAGGLGDPRNGYTFYDSYGGSLTYIYEPEMFDLWGEDVLTLANHGYTLCSHTYVAEGKAATCTEPGYMVYTCSKCGDSYEEGSDVALGHVPEVIPAVPATCEKEGATAGERCGRCKEILKAPETLPKTDHDYSDGTLEYDEKLRMHSATCKHCGNKIKEECVFDFKNGTVIKEATDTEDGIILHACLKCGGTHEEVIPHDFDGTLRLPFNAEEWDVLKRVNAERFRAGLEPVAGFHKLQKAARTRSTELRTYYSHTRPNGAECFTALDEAGVDYSFAGENIAQGAISADIVMEGWMESPGHRANILNEDFGLLGVGMDCSCWAQLFIDDGGGRVANIYVAPNALRVEPGTYLDDMKLSLILDHTVYGECYLPVIQEFCEGYDPYTAGVQQVVVSAFGRKTLLFVEVVQDSPTLELPFEEWEWETLRLVNEERLKNGLDPLTSFQKLQEAAQLQADRIAQGTGIGDTFSPLDEKGVAYNAVSAGTSFEHTSPQKAVEKWMSSSFTSENFLDSSYKFFGLGIHKNVWLRYHLSGGGSYRRMDILPFEVTVEAGTPIEEMDLVAVVNHSAYGNCYLPVSSAYCSGYDPERIGTQVVTVSTLGQTTTLTVHVAGECDHAQTGYTNGKEAGCTAAGYTGDKTCVSCGVILEYGEVIPALDHSFSGKPADYDAALKIHMKTCDRCGYKAAENCTFDSGTTTREPTAGTPGIITYTCTQCGGTYEEVFNMIINTTRIYGRGRCQTAMEAARMLKQIKGIEKFDTIVVANAGGFPDALSGSYLAAAAGAPILLYAEGQSAVLEYINANIADGGKVYILGGVNSVPEDVEKSLKSGITVERLAGRGRYDTSLAIIEAGDALRGGKPEAVLVCTGVDYADSLSASATGLPILLVNGKEAALTEAQKDYLGSLRNAEIYIIGGENTVSGELQLLLNAYDRNGEAKRISGSGREKTSAAVARTFFPEAKALALAYSRDFPDGLAGGPVAYALGAPLLLISAERETAAAEYASEKEITTGYILGGTNSVSDRSVRAVFGVK